MATTEVNSLSLHQFQSVQKAMSLPTVEAAVGQVGALYCKVKGTHSLVEWALSQAEAGVTAAVAGAAPLVAAPLAGADARLAAALTALEQRVPLLQAPPKVIVDTTRQALLDSVAPTINKVCGARDAASRRVSSLRELSWARAEALLATAAGRRVLSQLDAGAATAMRLLDHYLPDLHPNQDNATESSEPAGQAGTRDAARRLAAALARTLHHLRLTGVELDVRRYVAALAAGLKAAAASLQQPDDVAAPSAPHPVADIPAPPPAPVQTAPSPTTPVVAAAASPVSRPDAAAPAPNPAASAASPVSPPDAAAPTPIPAAAAASSVSPPNAAAPAPNPAAAIEQTPPKKKSKVNVTPNAQ